MYQWRKFQFFDDRTPAGDLPEELRSDLTCSTSGRGQAVFGSSDGMCHIIDRGLKVKASFRAHAQKVLQLQQLKQRNMLVTIGEDEPPGAHGVLLKLWDLDKLTSALEATSASAPSSVKSMRLFTAKFPEAGVTALLVLEESSPVVRVAIGLDSGLVYMLQGDLGRERLVRSKLEVDPPVEGRAGRAVTGLAARSENGIVHLFAVSSEVVTTFNLQQQHPQRHVVDQHGCDVHCLTVSDAQEPVLGRPEAVYFYEVEGRGPCWAFEGPKQYLSWFRGYLLCVLADPRKPDRSVLNIYDLKNKLIAFTAPVGVVKHVVSSWGMIIVLTADHKALCLVEKDMGSKLDMLFRKNLYTIAINLVQSQQADAAATADVMRKYGDHLYGKQDYDEAMAQYIRTIGELQPSYVIQKFLDAQRIHNLTSYLEKLHKKGLATADHTTLLLNCYTKLKDVAKLDSFIKAEGEQRFDVETAVKVCRAAGYFEHALWVAKKASEHQWYLRILLEDLQHFEEGLRYIASLPTFEAAATLRQYGKTLVTHRPGETTAVLLRLCTEPPKKAGGADTAGGFPDLPSPTDFMHVFVDRPQWLLRLFEQYTDKVTGSSEESVMHNTMLELYLSEDLKPTAALRASAMMEPIKVSEEEVREAAADQAARRVKALGLLKAGWPPHESTPKYDPDLALVLCQMHHFKEGMLFLYEKMRLYKEVMACYEADRDFAGLLACCRQLGDASRGGDTSLWADLLAFLGENGGPDCEKEVREVLQVIERDRLLPPLIALQMLAKNPHLTLGTVKDYVARQIAQETALIEEDRKAIEKYQEETAAMRAEVAELRTSARVFQASKCTACSQALDLPAVHFLCMHSFHARCLGDNEKECPTCAPANRTLLEMKRTLEQSANDHDRFFQLVQNSEDGFSVIAEYFGRGILSRAPAAAESDVSGGGSSSPILNLGQLVLSDV